MNRLYATLSDDDRRRRYDATLHRIAEDAPAPPKSGSRFMSSFAWLACALLGIGGIGWYAAQDPARPPAVSAVAALPVEVRQARFEGTWLSPGASIDPAGPPPNSAEQIEIEIAEAGGRIRGSFHGQHSISGNTLPSRLNFSFAGFNRGPMAIFPWRGEHGAAGELQLRLLAEDSMEVVWSAAGTSNDLSLTSGTATLIRRKTP